MKKVAFRFQRKSFNHKRWKNPWKINFEDNPNSKKYVNIFLPVIECLLSLIPLDERLTNGRE